MTGSNISVSNSIIFSTGWGASVIIRFNQVFKNLMPIQQKGRRVLNTLQEKVDKEIDKLLAQGHTQKLEESTVKYFFSPKYLSIPARNTRSSRWNQEN